MSEPADAPRAVPAISRGSEIARAVATIVAAHPVPAGELLAHLTRIYTCLADLAAEFDELHEAPPEGGAVLRPSLRPAVHPDNSLQPHGIICLECGSLYRSLAKHLRVAHGLRPDEYRHRHDLSAVYPMTINEMQRRGLRADDAPSLADEVSTWGHEEVGELPELLINTSLNRS